ncbi:unnamed protein product [Protopolystoma xenopodis]|uniref:Uncharacterized protein n=1 Tax=Protopolystoma xenopodis TaxID=117903 RepID=A0A448XD24_9PLAT|nr:unnamed protein product [Protopolystoma xenopodis]
MLRFVSIIAPHGRVKRGLFQDTLSIKVDVTKGLSITHQNSPNQSRHESFEPVAFVRRHRCSSEPVPVSLASQRFR